jgi:hypothetical protein
MSLTGACRSTTASPYTPLQQPILRGSALRGINESSSNSPVRSSPHPRPPGWNGQPLRHSPGLRTPPTKSRTTHARMGTRHRARTWNYTLNITSRLILQSCSSLTTRDLASHHGKRQSDRDRSSGAKRMSSGWGGRYIRSLSATDRWSTISLWTRRLRPRSTSRRPSSRAGRR